MNKNKQHKMVVKHPQYEVVYVPTSPEPAIRNCAGCRWFKRRGEYSNISGCQIVEEYPLEILATGLCNRHEPLPEEVLPQPPEPMEVEVINLAPIQERGVTDRLLRRKVKTGMTFYKGDDGMRIAALYVSNGYKDREQEFVVTKALERYVEDSYDDSGAWIGDNVLDFWHDKQLWNIGRIIGADMHKGFLFEVAKEREHPVVQYIWDYWMKTEAEKSVVWGVSHEFGSNERGTYNEIEKRKTSILPTYAAANLLTAGAIVK